MSPCGARECSRNSHCDASDQQALGLYACPGCTNLTPGSARRTTAGLRANVESAGGSPSNDRRLRRPNNELGAFASFLEANDRCAARNSNFAVDYGAFGDSDAAGDNVCLDDSGRPYLQLLFSDQLP